MSALVLDGKAIAAELTAGLAGLSPRPGLAVVLVGADPASSVYVRNKTRMAEKIGFYHEQINLPESCTQQELLAVVRRLNQDARIHGILVQLPLPRHLDSLAVLDSIDPSKDVDGFHVVNTGRLWQRRACLSPCTPTGVMELLRRTGMTLRGAEALVIGRSNIVGKPMVALLEREDCTVTLAHSRTRELAGHVRRADVLVAAVGVPELVKGAWIREGAVVIDVGMNRGADGKLVGDVEYAMAAQRAGWITPVPGGVGPMTIAMLMVNTARAAGALPTTAG